MRSLLIALSSWAGDLKMSLVLLRRARSILAALCAVGLILVCPSGAGAQPSPSFAQRHWTAEDGLPVNSVRDITEGPQGYLWLATYDGLVRFDGVEFT